MKLIFIFLFPLILAAEPYQIDKKFFNSIILKTNTPGLNSKEKRSALSDLGEFRFLGAINKDNPKEVLMKKDKKAAFKAFSYLYELGDLKASTRLAPMYYYGDGVKKDLKKAKSFYEIATHNELYENPEELKEAKKILSNFYKKEDRKIRSQKRSKQKKTRLVASVNQKAKNKKTSNPLLASIPPVDLLKDLNKTKKRKPSSHKIPLLLAESNEYEKNEFRKNLEGKTGDNEQIKKCYFKINEKSNKSEAWCDVIKCLQVNVATKIIESTSHLKVTTDLDFMIEVLLGSDKTHHFYGAFSKAHRHLSLKDRFKLFKFDEIFSPLYLTVFGGSYSLEVYQSLRAFVHLYIFNSFFNPDSIDKYLTIYHMQASYLKDYEHGLESFQSFYQNYVKKHNQMQDYLCLIV